MYASKKFKDKIEFDINEKKRQMILDFHFVKELN